MFDQKVVDDIERNMRKIEEVYDFLDKIYYNPEIAEFFGKTVLTRIIDETDFVMNNLTMLRNKYLTLKS